MTDCSTHPTTFGYLSLRSNTPYNAPQPLRPPARGRADPRASPAFCDPPVGHPYGFSFTLRRLALLYDWFGDHIRVQPAGPGETLACRLTDRLAALQRSSGALVVVVAEYDPVVWDHP